MGKLLGRLEVGIVRGSGSPDMASAATTADGRLRGLLRVTVGRASEPLPPPSSSTDCNMQSHSVERCLSRACSRTSGMQGGEQQCK